MSKLHPTQRSLLKLLEDNIDDPLTVRELQECLGLSSPSLVAHHIQQLEKKGWLKRNPYNPHDYRLLKSPERPVVFLNLYGLAQCGPEGSILNGNPVDRIAVSTKILDFSSEQAFMVKASGDSMKPLINEGDLVIAKRANLVRDGSLVVCVNDGMALIKRYHTSNGHVLLESENSNEYPAFLAKDDFRIEGEVKGIMAAVR